MRIVHVSMYIVHIKYTLDYSYANIQCTVPTTLNSTCMNLYSSKIPANFRSSCIGKRDFLKYLSDVIITHKV